MDEIIDSVSNGVNSIGGVAERIMEEEVTIALPVASMISISVDNGDGVDIITVVEVFVASMGAGLGVEDTIESAVSTVALTVGNSEVGVSIMSSEGAV